MSKLASFLMVFYLFSYIPHAHADASGEPSPYPVSLDDSIPEEPEIRSTPSAQSKYTIPIKRNQSPTTSNTSSEQNTSSQTTPKTPPAATPTPPTVPFPAFTGKIVKNKVRLRTDPSLDGRIVRELNGNDLVMVLGEVNDFYAVEPPSDTKAYIFRTYVLDGVIEGNHVNVRLEPDLGAPVIAQLNSGEPVKGNVSDVDKKWMEIAPPPSTRFYVAKEYVDKIGNASLLGNIKKRREEVSTMLDSARSLSQSEMQKPFDQIDIKGLNNKLSKIISQYNDFPNEVAQAKELQNMIQTAYLNKKLAYMETSQIQAQAKAAMEAKSAPQNAQPQIEIVKSSPPVIRGISSKMAAWLPVEQAIFEEWLALNGEGSQQDFYLHQELNGMQLRGIIEPFPRTIKNKPGDYILVNPSTRVTMAYLYSTKTNLDDVIGHEVKLKVASRPNQNFAYPAYYVLAVD